MSRNESPARRTTTKRSSRKARNAARPARADATAATIPTSRLSLRAAGAPTHVLDRNTGHFWKIRPVDGSTFVNAPDCDYEIVMDLRPMPPPSRIQIKLGDRFEISAGAGGLVLTHLRDGEIVGRSEDVAVDASGLWASGTATVPPLSGRVGDYFLYLVEDSPISRHSNAKALRVTGACTQVHFEYFDDDDEESASHRPAFGTTVVDVNGHKLAGKLETDEGDGDEGRRR
ncbi:MAG TPA: hypothetical protein VJ724_08610 [Tahibacter sp.]|nr:hypothetical protein [Tahibacter sp.]